MLYMSPFKKDGDMTARTRTRGPEIGTSSYPSGKVTAPVLRADLNLDGTRQGAISFVRGIAFICGSDFTCRSSGQDVVQWTASGTAKLKQVGDGMVAEAKATCYGLLGGLPSTASTTSRTFETMTDEVIPGFKSRSARGELFNNPMSRYEDSFKLSGFSYVSSETGSWSRGYPYIWNGKCTITFVTSNVSVTKTKDVVPLTYAEEAMSRVYALAPSLDNSHINGAFAKLQKADLDVAMMIAERKKTFSYIVALVLRAINAIESIARGSVGKAWRRRRLKSVDPQELAKFWLELRYALRPLLIDIDNTMRYLKSGANYKQGSRYTHRDGQNQSKAGTISYLVGATKITLDYSIEVTARAGILSEMTRDDSVSRLGLTNWASIGWELIPYSFVVNWLIDVSALLYRLNPNVSFNPLIAWDTRETTLSFTGRYEVSTPGGPREQRFSGTSLQKYRAPTPLVPTIIPSIHVNFDVNKALDILALARQLYRR
nr:MAG: hypothetical protein 1 [Leviviridae sp.]